MYETEVLLHAVRKAQGRARAAVRDRQPAPVVASRQAELTDASAAYAVAKVLADAPAMTPEGKARVLALIDAAPVLEVSA